METLIAQCINGERERECEYCPAHQSKNGDCCFGVRHEHGDRDCMACVLSDECAPLTHGYAPRTPRPAPSRIIYPNRRVPNSQGGSRVRVRSGPDQFPIVEEVGPQPGEPLLVQRPIEPQPIQLNPKDSLFKRFLQVSSWGAGEGFFEMALNFFRKRRPE